MAHPSGGAARRLGDALLSVVALVGGVCLLTALLGPLLGLHVVFFKSGSMSPTIPRGSIAMVHRVAVSDVRPGQVVSVTDPDGTRVTHRVVRREHEELTLKGDANKAADPTTYRASKVDRVVLHVPAVGYVAGFATTPLGGVAVVGIAFLLIGLLTGRRRPAIGVGVVVLGMTIVGPLGARPAWAAAWSDPVAVTGGNLTADSVPASTVSCGTLAVLSTTLTWSSVTGATGYEVHTGPGGATVTTVGPGTLTRTLTSAGDGTFFVKALHDYGSVSWASAASNSKAYSVVVGVPGTCS